jgi:hypothetical protein
MSAPKEAGLTIGKLDAARRQLETALTLWFNDGDPVSIHTLACAAYEIIHAVSEKRNPYRRDLLFDTLVVKDEYRQKFNALMKSPANFFKHADRDGEAAITFQTNLTQLFFMYSIMGIQFCVEGLNLAERSFLRWVQIFEPQYLTDKGRKDLADLIPVDDLRLLQTLTKSEFFQTMNAASKRGDGKVRLLVPVRS